MPIRLLIAGDASLAADAPVLIAVFEDTLTALGLVDRDDPLTLLVSTQIVQFAKGGERDPERLREMTLRAIRGG